MSLNYEQAGVNKEEGYKGVNLIKDIVSKTYSNAVISELGGFSGLFEIDKNSYAQPVLVSGTDGVGTKVKIAQLLDIHDTVGIDCVAMCVNDILCQGAKPLFFLDYIATGKLTATKMAKIVEGVCKGCLESKASLLGGETAEMPGIYKPEDYDIAGFCVGIVDREDIITGKNIKSGDVVIAIPSSGVHSNGFSLVRKILTLGSTCKMEQKPQDLQNNDENNEDIILKQELEKYVEELGSTIGEALLTPTKIYRNTVIDLIDTFKKDIKGISHITGGGIYENLPRILPDGLYAYIDVDKVPLHPIFSFLQHTGNIETKEMYGTFNMGFGMIIVTTKTKALDIVKHIESTGEKAYIAGEIRSGDKGVVLSFEVN